MIKYKKVENERARHMVNTLSVNASPYIVLTTNWENWLPKTLFRVHSRRGGAIAPTVPPPSIDPLLLRMSA